MSTLLALGAAAWGALSPGIYDKVVPSSTIPGVRAQDLLTIILCLGTLGLILSTKEDDIKKQIVILGIVGSFWYLYAIFSIERTYNLAYYLYLATFSASSWTIAYSLTSLEPQTVNSMSVPRALRFASAGFSLAIAALFSFLWVSALYPLVSTGTMLDFLYSIYILDLCFIMPAFVITAAFVLRRRGFGIAMSPFMYILGIFVIFPLGLGELAKPYFGMAPDSASMVLSFAFSAVLLVFAAANLLLMKRD